MASRPLAAITVRPEPPFRRDAYVSGLKRLGYEITNTPAVRPHYRDVVVLWNRHGQNDVFAKRYEAAGAAVLVTENGYLRGGPEFKYETYALARSHHNGAGLWTEGDAKRLSAFGLDLKPWRTDGRHVLVLPQRGIGEPGVAMPRPWGELTANRLRNRTKRPVQLRKHPGRIPQPLEPSFRDCWAAVTWGSGAAIKAIVAGIPVFYDFPRWIGAPAAKPLSEDLEQPFTGDRLPMLQRLAWAEWWTDELATGEPFARLLQ